MLDNLQYSPDAGGGGPPPVDPKSRPPAEPTIRPKQMGEDVVEEPGVDVDEQRQVAETWHRAGGKPPGEEEKQPKEENKPKP